MLDNSQRSPGVQTEPIVLCDQVSLDSVDSVVAMAVYSLDRTDWVKSALDSLAGQTYKKLVVVVIIDGQIVQDLEDYLLHRAKSNTNLVLLKNRLNCGLSASMNAVIDYVESMKPTYFFRMDADDISRTDRVEKQVAFFKSNPNISILGSALTEINEQGKKVGNRSLPLSNGDIVKYLPKRCSINHPTVGICYRVFENGFRYNSELKNTQDYFFWVDLASAGYKFANLPDKLLKFRRVNDFYKRRGLNKSLNEFHARFYAMKKLNKYSIGNLVYAFMVLFLRLMPPQVIKMAYKIDRYFLNKKVNH